MWVTILGALVLLIALVVLLVIYLFRRSLPQTSGKLRVPGLTAPVEILRDEWGVPHIYAANQDDLFFAQGYVHAQDRLWQMEMNRRLCYGTLSELFGSIALDTDRLLRTLGFGRAAAKDLTVLDESVRHILDVYARGVNTFIAQNRQPPAAGIFAAWLQARAVAAARHNRVGKVYGVGSLRQLGYGIVARGVHRQTGRGKSRATGAGKCDLAIPRFFRLPFFVRSPKRCSNNSAR